MKTYLGDSVYGDVEHGMLKLTTENGLGPSNTIYLEPEVFARVLDYVNAMGTKLGWAAPKGEEAP